MVGKLQHVNYPDNFIPNRSAAILFLNLLYEYVPLCSALSGHEMSIRATGMLTGLSRGAAWWHGGVCGVAER